MSEMDKPNEDWLVHFNRERMIIEREKIEVIEEDLKTTKDVKDETTIKCTTET